MLTWHCKKQFLIQFSSQSCKENQSNRLVFLVNNSFYYMKFLSHKVKGNLYNHESGKRQLHILNRVLFQGIFTLTTEFPFYASLYNNSTKYQKTKYVITSLYLAIFYSCSIASSTLVNDLNNFSITNDWVFAGKGKCSCLKTKKHREATNMLY